MDTILSSNLYTDLILIGLVIFGFLVQLLMIYLIQKYERYTLLMSLFMAFIALCQSLIIYASFIEPKKIEVKQQKITLNNKNNNDRQNLKIVVVSDYHVGPFKKAAFVNKSVELINKENPDLVLVPGDFVFGQAKEADYLAPLAKIKSKYGVYAVLGNHDYDLIQTGNVSFRKAEPEKLSPVVAEKVQIFGVKLLRNDKAEININGKKLTIIGIEDYYATQGKYNDVLDSINTDETTILLEHSPDIIRDARAYKADLIVSGHTHGGQLRLPGYGPLYGIPTNIGKKYDYGLFDLNGSEAGLDSEEKKNINTQLYITKGIGEIGTRMRLFCRPEIVVLDLEF